MTEKTIQEGKLYAVVSYLTFIGSIIAIIMNSDVKNPFTTFHNRQGLGLCLSFLLLGYFLGQFDSWLISGPFLFGFGLLLVFGVITAASGKMVLIPVIGALFQKIFSNIIK
ncbi:hypothetical protein [Aurantibacter aestuarii]|uniref:DUF4870 domain-containing protein n=1 Tax=Aurantibacter aestuarii TaxID=1266046 RepID=A0A2T1N896_9FLAO|nr:hypothetical protein [Aurantibacter aestuarii]PSG88094.1 hypothetical protein C7H52_07250 [Aurantibacter aestuarii]